ncbi:hypothetical protein D8S78_16695 [Natrialba swarupiae]|nr:hypothetical protein [Natrialba swarupiae]
MVAFVDASRTVPIDGKYPNTDGAVRIEVFDPCSSISAVRFRHSSRDTTEKQQLYRSASKSKSIWHLEPPLVGSARCARSDCFARRRRRGAPGHTGPRGVETLRAVLELTERRGRSRTE